MALLKDDWNWIAGGALSSATVVVAMFGLGQPAWIVAGASLGVFAASTWLLGPILPQRQLSPQVFRQRGDAAGELMVQAEPLARRLRKLAGTLETTESGTTVKLMATKLDDIMEKLHADPERIVPARRLLTYYLPNAVTVCEAYARTLATNPGSDRIPEIREGIVALEKAFHHYATTVDEQGLDELAIDLKLLQNSVREDLRG